MGTAADGPMRIQIVDYGQEPNFQLTVDALDWGVANANQIPGTDPKGQNTGRSRKIISLGQTDLTNARFVDINNNGAGLLAEVATDPNGPFKGGLYEEGKADCMDFAQEMIKRVFPQTPANAEFDDWVKLWKVFVLLKFQGIGAPAQTKLQLAARQVTAWGTEAQNTVHLYKFTDAGSPEFVSQGTQESRQILQDTAHTPNADSDPIAAPWEEQRPTEISTHFGSIKSPFDTSGEGSCRRSYAAWLGRRCASGQNLGGKSINSMALVRVNGAFATIALATEAAVQAAGAAAAALGAVVVILDFVNGNWLGGALGAAGLVLGIVATVSLAGPVGWLLGGLIAAFFAILPGLFGSATTMPSATNTTEIIQWKMFGDASHTGNEQCRKQNPDCQAVYGPGVIALSFGWETFDAVTFLINFNQGFPMTIPDMAVAFKFNGSQGAIAVVDCHNGKWVQSGRGAAAGMTGDNPRWCNHPAFSMSRDITLPSINVSAASVYSRIIPAPGGDCKLQDGASNAVNFTAYDLSVTGLPVSIACNISASINDNGMSLPIGAPIPPAGFKSPDGSSTSAVSNNTDNQVSASNNTLVSPANASTNHQGGAYVAPPPPTPFSIPFNSSNALCLSGTTGSGCFPNGTFDEPSGLFGLTLAGVTDLTIPVNSGSSLTLTQFVDARRGWATRVFNTNVSNNDNSSFSIYIKNINNLGTNPPIVVTSPQLPPPAACLFTKAQYGGDVFCLGPGGGNLTGVQTNSAHSIQVLGGATVWIYASTYGDGGGQKLTVSVPDLGTEPYGTEGNFGGQIKALWISAAGT